MTDVDWRGLARDWLATRNYASNTRIAYQRSIDRFLAWCDRNATSPATASPSTIADYLDESRTVKPGTQRMLAMPVRVYFGYLVQQGLVAANPADAFGREPIDRSATRDVLTLDQLAAIWEGATRLQDRVIVGLLGICGVRLAELRTSRVDHFTTRDGILVMDLPERKGPHEFDHVALPPAVAADVMALIDGRRSGLLLRGRRGREEATDRAIRLAIERAAASLDLPFRVLPLTLSLTLRSIAIERGFSYAAVVRSVSEVEPRRLAAWVRRIHIDFREHASYQLGQLVSQAQNRDEGLFIQAERLLNDRSQSPVAGLVLTAAAFERVLRELVERHEKVTKRDPTLQTYADRLLTRRLISASEHRTISKIVSSRNDAAHGWFDLIQPEEAKWVLVQCRRITRRLTAGGGAQEGTEGVD